MSAILKLALCPAPFQPKKKDDKKKKKKRTCPEPPVQHVMTDTFITPPFTDTTVRSTGVSSNGHNRLQPRLSSGSPRSSTSSNGNSHHQPQACDNLSMLGGRNGNYSNGYQSHYHGGSGYVTDGDGAFEAQLLQRATRDRPANLRMTAVRDYAPCCNEELAVRKGQRVKVLYRNHDWVFAVTKHGQQGFLPFSYVRPSRKYSGYQSEPEITRIDDAYVSGYDTDVPGYKPYPLISRQHLQCSEVPQSYSINTGYHRTGSGSPIQTRIDFDSGYLSAFEASTNPYPSRQSPPSHSFRPSTVKPSIDSFAKCYIEELVVIHDFEAHEEDEVVVFKGDRVQVLNADDPKWLWVATLRSRREGFIPRSCCTLGNHPALSTPVATRPTQSRHRQHHSNVNAHRNMKMQARDRFRQLAYDRTTNNPTKMDKETIKRIGTKLIVLMDYEATNEDELTLEFSESVIADILTQTGSERIWVYCPRTDECGFVPMSMVVPPVV